MAAALGDALQIVDYQTYLGQQVLNVYHYRVTSITGLAATYWDDIMTWFDDNVISAVLPIQSSLLVHDRLEFLNLSNGIDIGTMVLAEAGTRTGTTDTSMASFMTYTFQQIRESRATRNGSKRIAGLLEPDLQGNVSTIASGLLDTYADAIAADIVLGIVTVAEPIILRKDIPVPMGTGYTYASVGAGQYLHVGTQNTRKQGRGI